MAILSLCRLFYTHFPRAYGVVWLSEHQIKALAKDSSAASLCLESHVYPIHPSLVALLQNETQQLVILATQS